MDNIFKGKKVAAKHPKVLTIFKINLLLFIEIIRKNNFVFVISKINITILQIAK